MPDIQRRFRVKGGRRYIYYSTEINAFKSSIKQQITRHELVANVNPFALEAIPSRYRLLHHKMSHILPRHSVPIMLPQLLIRPKLIRDLPRLMRLLQALRLVLVRKTLSIRQQRRPYNHHMLQRALSRRTLLCSPPSTQDIVLWLGIFPLLAYAVREHALHA